MKKKTKIILSFVIFFSSFLVCQKTLAATYYIDYTAGLDSNNGITTSAPWKLAPGMVGFAGTYSHVAGDTFVFKGGITWPATVLPLTISYSGTAGNPDIYMGGQQCGYTPASPFHLDGSNNSKVCDGTNAPCGSTASVSCNGGVAWGTGYPIFNGHNAMGPNGSLLAENSKNYITVDGIQLLRIGDIAYPWVTGTAYTVGQIATNGTLNYKCLIAHTSGVLATDITNGDWLYLGDTSVVWVTNTAYTVGQYVFDPSYSKFYKCLVAHTSGNLNTDYATNHYWQLMGQVDGTGTSITSGGNYIEIKNCNLQPYGVQAWSYGNNTASTSNVLFHDNFINYAGRSVIYGYSGYVLTNVQVYNNIILGTDFGEGAYFHLDGFMIGNPLGALCTGQGQSVISGITFHHNRFSGAWATATAEIYSNGCTDSATIYDNLFYKEADTGMFSPGNVVFYMWDSNLLFYNNTFSSDAEPGFANGSNSAIYLGNPYGTVSIENNIFSGFGIDITGSTTNTPTIDYNLHNLSAAGGRTDWGYWSGVQYNTWTSWQAAGFDTHGLNNPTCVLYGTCTYSNTYAGFVAAPTTTPGIGNLALVSNSPAIDAGANLSTIFTTDYLGVTRTGTWDIGACEYVSGTTDTTPPAAPSGLAVS